MASTEWDEDEEEENAINGMSAAATAVVKKDKAGASRGVSTSLAVAATVSGLAVLAFVGRWLSQRGKTDSKSTKHGAKPSAKRPTKTGCASCISLHATTRPGCAPFGRHSEGNS